MNYKGLCIKLVEKLLQEGWKEFWYRTHILGGNGRNTSFGWMGGGKRLLGKGIFLLQVDLFVKCIFSSG